VVGTPSANVFFADYYANQLLEVPATEAFPR